MLSVGVLPIASHLLFLLAQCIETGEHNTGACDHYQWSRPVHYTFLLKERGPFFSDPCPGWDVCVFCCALHQGKGSSGKTQLNLRHFLFLVWKNILL